MKTSPTTKLLKRVKLKGLQRDLEYSLFHSTHGLMDANCHTLYPINTTEQKNKAIIAMQAIKNRVLEYYRHAKNDSKEAKQAIDFLVNANGLGGLMLSYPTGGRGDCGRLKAPRLDLFYDVCAEAQSNGGGVDCGHIYLHRDPLAILVSTTVKRPFNPSIHSALHTYTSFLHILYAHLTLYPTKTIACLGFYEPDMTNEWKVVRVLAGWSSKSGFSSKLLEQDFQHQVVERIYAPPTDLSQEERQTLFPDYVYGPNLRAMWTAHENLLELCREQVRTNIMQARRQD